MTAWVDLDYVFRSSWTIKSFVAFAGGAVLMTVPATLDRFVVLDLALRCLRKPQGYKGKDAGAFQLVATMIQDFTKLAFVAISFATASCSGALLFRGRSPARGVGLLGSACAVVSVCIMAS